MIHISHVVPEGVGGGTPILCERCGGDLADGMVALGVCEGAEANRDGLTYRTRDTEDPTDPPNPNVVLPPWYPSEGPGD